MNIVYFCKKKKIPSKTRVCFRSLEGKINSNFFRRIIIIVIEKKILTLCEVCAGVFVFFILFSINWCFSICHLSCTS